MKYFLKTIFWLALLGALACAQTTTANPKMPYPNPFKHIILIIQENRSPDQLFQTLLTYSGVNPANYDIASSGLALVNGQQEVIQLTPRPLSTDYDLGHSHQDFELMWDNGAMDGANLILDTCNANSTDCQNQGIGEFLSYKYVQASDIQPYLQLVAQYGWANRMFQTNQSDSYASHQILFSGPSAESADDDASGTFVDGIPGAPKGSNYYAEDDTGCLAPEGEVNAAINPTTAPNTYTITNDPIGTFCLQHDSIATLLDQAQLPWKYYSQDITFNPYPNDPSQVGYNPAGSFWNAAASIYQVCLPDYDGGEPVCTNPNYAGNLDLNPSDVLTDIAKCNLGAVSWVTPIGQNSDHPGEANSVNGHFLGCLHREFGWSRDRMRRQRLLVGHRDPGGLGRLGRLVRPRAASDSAGGAGRFRTGIPGSISCDFRLHPTGVRLQSVFRLWQHPALHGRHLQLPRGGSGIF